MKNLKEVMVLLMVVVVLGLTACAGPLISQKTQGSILLKLETYLESRHVAFKQIPQESDKLVVLAFYGDGRNAGRLSFRAVVKEERKEIIFCSTWQTIIPPEKRLAMLEYINRVNEVLSIGSLIMNIENGYFGCKTSINVLGGELTPTMIGTQIGMNLATMDRFIPGVEKVINDVPPKTAVDEIYPPTFNL